MPSEDHIPVVVPPAIEVGPPVKCAICLRFLDSDEPASRARSRSHDRTTGEAELSEERIGRDRPFAPVVVTLSQEAEAQAAREAEARATDRETTGGMDEESRLCSRCWETQGSVEEAGRISGEEERGEETHIDGPAGDPADRSPGDVLISTGHPARTSGLGLEATEESTAPAEAGDITTSPSPTPETATFSPPPSFSAILSGTASSSKSATYRPATPTALSQRQREKQADTTPVCPVVPEWTAPNPLLDVGRLRVPSVGRGVLRPGALFRGTQTSGRSSYDVEVRILDISFPLSTLSGYLSISHLTDTHPKLTTFFSGEIIGPTYGFLTGPRYYAQATEADDMRHWSRFPHFRKIRNELRRPGLTMPEPRVDRGMGRERSFCFMRWKERFLVPDHKVRDISGASFAGFYYIQVDLDPQTVAASTARPHASTTTTTTIMTSPVNTPPPLPRHNSRESRANATRTRASASGTPPTTPGATSRTFSGGVATTGRTRSPAHPPQPTRRTSSSAAERDRENKEPVPMLTGYYFHHQNSEPFQELSLRYIPQSGSGVAEMR